MRLSNLILSHLYRIFIVLFLLYYFISLTVTTESDQFISVITDYECVTCHRIFQSEDVSLSYIYIYIYVCVYTCIYVS